MQRLNPFQGWRLTLFQAVVFAVFLLFTIRMYQIQILEGDFYQAQADENRLSRLPIPAPRGVISDRYGAPLAINVPAFNVTVIPAALPSAEEEVLRIYNRLSALVGVPPTRAAAQTAGRRVRSIEELVAEGEGFRPYSPVVIAQDVERRVAMQILEEGNTLPGVDVQVAAVREYPTGALTSHIIGYMGRIPAEQELELLAQGYDPAYDRIGYAGIEAYLEPILAGQRGSILREVDVAGAPVSDVPVEQVNAVPGQNIRLTLDAQLQTAAEEALRNRISRINAEAQRIITQTGVVIAMNPKTGEILAMVSYPSYDNARFARTIDVDYYLDVTANPLRPLYNQTVSSLYPPGSVWKVVTALGVLEEGVVAPETLLNDPGRLVLPNRYAPNDRAASQTFVCWLREGHGNLDMIGAIANSCDVYFYQVGGGNPEVSRSVLREGGLGINDLFRYATAVGIGSQLGIELPGENAGRMPDPDWKRRIYGESWSTGDTYNAAFGQGYVTVTPLQLIASVAAIANGGTLYQPTIIRDYLDAEGNILQPFTPHVLRDLDIDAVDDVITLLPVEDMIMKGPSSLTCTCETDSPYYNPLRCDPVGYRNTVDINPDPYLETLREYKVSVPSFYRFTAGLCNELRFDPKYQPAFVSTRNMQIVEQGMRQTVLVGTAKTANLDYVEVAGKTGTAEYCDDIARPLGLCVPGNWPSHAWFTAYAPYEDPEILVIAFVYNGGEGSRNALPIVMDTMQAYFRLKNERESQPQQIELTPGTVQ